MMRVRAIRVGLLTAVLFGCPSTETASAGPGKLKFKDGSGSAAFAIKPKDDGAKVVDGAGREIARLKNKGAKTKVKGPDDRVIAIVKGDSSKLKILTESGEERFALKAGDGGKYKLKNAAGETLYEVKPKDYGFKIVDGAGRDVAKVKKKGDKTKLKNAAGNTLYETKDPVSAAAVACLAFDAARATRSGRAVPPPPKRTIDEPRVPRESGLLVLARLRSRGAVGLRSLQEDDLREAREARAERDAVHELHEERPREGGAPG